MRHSPIATVVRPFVNGTPEVILCRTVLAPQELLSSGSGSGWQWSVLEGVHRVLQGVHRVFEGVHRVLKGVARAW